MRIAVAMAVVAAGLSTVPAGAAAPKPTSPAARQAPYVALAHKVLLKSPVKARATVSFRATGLAGVPTTASAVVVSVTVPTPIASGTLTFFSYGTKRPATVSLAYAKGRTATATVVLVPSTTGKVSLYNASTKGDKVIATVTGFYAAPGSTSAANAKTRFVPLTPKRVSSAALGTKSVSFATGVPSTGVAGVVLSVTVPAPAKAGSLSLYGFGAKPAAAAIAYAAHRPTTSLVVVPVGSKGRVTVLNHAKAAVRVWVDVVGYLHQLKVPSAPRSVVATAQNGGALITWSPPAVTGGAPVASYRIEVLPGGSTMLVPGQALQTSVGGLKNGTAYTFSVVAVNSVGSGPSAVSAPIIPYGVPASPTAVVAKATGLGTATVTWTAPTETGGVPLTGYRIVTTPGSAATTAAASPATVSGLTSGQVYSFTVVATNAGSPSLPSTPSNTVLGEGTSRVSISSTGAEGTNDGVGGASFSADGRYVAFTSSANNLTPDDKTPDSDVFVRDRLLGTTTLVSVPLPGVTNTGMGSAQPSMSADGRYVAFVSSATNLVSPSTTRRNIFVRDLVAGVTRLVSVDRVTGLEADRNSDRPVISADGSSIGFQTIADDIVAGDTNNLEDVFVVNRVAGAARMVSLSAGGAASDGDSFRPSMSQDGRYVAFDSDATNLVTGFVTGAHEQVYVNDAVTHTTAPVSAGTTMANHGGNDDSQTASISADGSYVAYDSLATDLGPTDANPYADVYLDKLATSTVTRISKPASGVETTADSVQPLVSADGRFVTFGSFANNIVLADTNAHYDVFRYDAITGMTERLSTSSAGAQGDGDSIAYGATPDGQHVVFWSASANLVPGDTNGYIDTFVRDLG